MKQYGISLLVLMSLVFVGCSSPAEKNDQDLSNLFRMQLNDAIAEFDKRYNNDQILEPKSIDVQGTQTSLESITQMVLLNPDAEDNLTIPLEMGYTCAADNTGDEWTATGSVMIVANPDPCSATIKLTADASFSTFSIGEVNFSGKVLRNGTPKDLDFRALIGMSANVQVAESTGNLIAQELANQNLQVIAKQVVADLNQAIAQVDNTGAGVEDQSQQLTIGSLDILTSTTPVLGQSPIKNVVVLPEGVDLSTGFTYPLISLGEGEAYSAEASTNCEVESQRAPQLGVAAEFSVQKIPLEEEAPDGLGDIPICPLKLINLDLENNSMNVQIQTEPLPVEQAGANRQRLVGFGEFEHGLKDTVMYDITLDVLDADGEVIGKNVHTVILTLNSISPTKVDEAPLYNYIGSFEGSDYYLSANKISLDDARDHAKRIKEIVNAQDAYVVTISSQEEQDYLLVNAGRSERLWIGFSDEVVEGNFIWDGDENSSYTNWFGNEPNNRKNEDWTVMNWKVNDQGGWNDVRSPKYKFRAIVEVKK